MPSEPGHEGRGAGKTATPGGHTIVSEKRKVTEKMVTEKTWLLQTGCVGKLVFQVGTSSVPFLLINSMF